MGRSVHGFVARSRWWMRWVNQWVGSWHDLAGGRGGSIDGWVRGAISPVLGSVWVARCDCELASFFSLSLSLFAHLMSSKMD